MFFKTLWALQILASVSRFLMEYWPRTADISRAERWVFASFFAGHSGTSRRLTNLQLGNYCLPIMFSIARTERENTADCTTSAPAIGSDVGVMYEPPIRALPRFITARYRGVGNCKRIAPGRRMECPEINRRVIFSRLNESLPTCHYFEDEINDI